MQLLTPLQLKALRPWFVPERPGPLVGPHVLHTGNGAAYADRWPDPQALLINTAGNYSLRGCPDALQPADLVELVQGFVEAPPAFLPLLQATFSQVEYWPRIILELPAEPTCRLPPEAYFRRLQREDAHHLWALSSGSNWIVKTWGGPPGAAASGMAWGAFVNGRLVSVALTFFVGERYEELGVVTEPGFRGRGLSAACAGQLARDIRARGRIPSWTTSTDNTASQRVAEKIGFSFHRHDTLYLVGQPRPEPPQSSSL
jgi:RimJ/RimL family protein N-acetyltransferase